MPESEYAVRHPKRGKAHQRTTDRYTSTLYPRETVCGLPNRNMTERIPVEQTAPEDRCRRCFPTTTPPTADERAALATSEESDK